VGTHKRSTRARLLPVLGIIVLVAALLAVGRVALATDTATATDAASRPPAPPASTTSAPEESSDSDDTSRSRKSTERPKGEKGRDERGGKHGAGDGKRGDGNSTRSERHARQQSIDLRDRVQVAADESADDPAGDSTVDAASFRIASFNVLGFSHTKPGGNKCCRWAGGVTRMSWALQLIRSNGFSVVGFQELEKEQHNAFMSMTDGSWAAYPGMHLGNNPVRNSIAWNVNVFELVEAHTIGIPYFHGKLVPMPYVLLKHKETGRLAWFINIHNPASVRGPAQHWRDVATSREVALMNDLQAPQSYGQAGIPTFLTGDFNEKGEAFCRVTAGANAQAANGGNGSPCQLPAKTGIDWIFGSTPGVSFSGYVRLDGGLVARATDHPLVFSDVTLSGGTPRME